MSTKAEKTEKTEKIEKPKKLKKTEKTYLADRYILWKKKVFSVCSFFSVVFSFFPLFFSKKMNNTEKTEKPIFGRQIYSMEKYSFFSFFSFFSVFRFFQFFFRCFSCFSVFPVVLVLATRCIPLAKFG